MRKNTIRRHEVCRGFRVIIDQGLSVEINLWSNLFMKTSIPNIHFLNTSKLTISFSLLFASLFVVVAARGQVIPFDLSPAGTDAAVGLSPLNEVPPATASTGSGNEIGSGISFDTSTSTLSFSIGYGSANGFSNLTGPATAMHIHGPAPTGTNAPVLIPLDPYHVPAADPTNGGTITGSVVLTPAQAADLLNSLDYVNIHTTAFPGGEVRAQLVPINSAPRITCPAPVLIECMSAAGAMVSLTANVSDADGDALTVVWKAGGNPYQTDHVPAGGPPTM